MEVRCVAVLTVLVFANLPAVAFAEPPCPGIHVQILNIRNSTGTVACTLFESPEGFPIEFLRSATNVMVIKIRKSQARCDFEDIPPGTYAMAVVHDENMNGKLETNWLGIPTEGYGFSNDATGLAGAPSFAAASFPYDGRNLDLTMSLHYQVSNAAGDVRKIREQIVVTCAGLLLACSKGQNPNRYEPAEQGLAI